MTQANSVHSTPPLNTPIPDTYRTPLRGYLFEAFAIAFILIAAGITSCLIANNLEGKIAHHCAVDLQRATQ